MPGNETGPLDAGEHVPEDLHELISCATHPDPSRRTVSVEAFASRLEEVLQARVALQQAEDEFLDVSQATSPHMGKRPTNYAVWVGAAGILTAAIGFFVLFG